MITGSGKGHSKARCGSTRGDKKTFLYWLQHYGILNSHTLSFMRWSWGRIRTMKNKNNHWSGDWLNCRRLFFSPKRCFYVHLCSVCRWSAILVPVEKWHFGLLFSNPFPTNTRLGPVQPGGAVGLSAAAMGIMNHLPSGPERYTKWINFK